MFERILNTLLLIEIFVLFLNGSRIIVPDENCPPTPKLTLSQTLTLTGGQFFSGAIVSLPSNPKTNPDLEPNPNRNRGGNFSRGAIVRIPSYTPHMIFTSKNFCRNYNSIVFQE